MTPSPTLHRPKARRRGWFVRAFAGVWCALQLAVVGGLPIVDAEIGHGPVVAHWEDVSDEQCPPQHGGLECSLFQVFGSGAAPAAGADAIAVGQPDADVARPEAADRIASGATHAPPASRGPPTA